MNSFDRARLVEAETLDLVLPFIEAKAMDGRYVVTDKGRLARTLQATVGDALFNDLNGRIVGVEIKGEQSERSGNLFLETWSNRARFTRGWLYSLQTDLLFYGFLDTRHLYVVSFRKLREWCFCHPGARGDEFPGRIWDFKEKRQGRYEQQNDTWGRCVPLEVLQREVGIRRYFLPPRESSDPRSIGVGR